MITRSVIMTAVESYRMVEKQWRWLLREMPMSWELLLIDDGSNPAIPVPDSTIEGAGRGHFFRRRPNRQPGEWTQKEAFNSGAMAARGEYLVKCDVDHILTPAAIAAANMFTGDMMLFERRAGRLHDDLQLQPLHVAVTSPVDDIYVLRRSIFQAKGGYPKEFERKYGGAGKQFWDYSRRPEAQPPAGALVYVTPPEFEPYHSLERVVA